MRRYYIVSGILLILSIINFALAAPILPREKHQARVGVVHIPKHMRTVFGKRGDGDLEKAVAEYLKTIKPTESSDAHASSSSALDHGSTDVGQAAPPNPASPTANPGLSMEPSSSLSTAPVSVLWEDPFIWDDKMSDKASYGSNDPMFTPGSSEYGSDDEWKAPPPPKFNPIPIPNPRPAPSTNPDNFDWNRWMNEMNPSPPKEVGQVHGYPIAGPSTGAVPDEFDWAHWINVVNPSPPKEVGQAHGYPNAGPSTGADPGYFDWENWRDFVNRPPPKEVGHANPGPSTLAGADPYFDWNLLNLKLPTKPVPDPNSMVAHQPPPYPLSSTEFDKDHDVNLPPSLAQSPTELYSYPFPGSVAPPTSPGARLPTVPEHEPAHPTFTDTGSEGEPEYEAAASLPLELEPLKEPEHEAISGPPPSPNPEFRLDHQSPSTDSQPVDPAAVLYGMKGKAKQLEPSRFSGTATDVENAAQGA
jgi:hypothetical protein